VTPLLGRLDQFSQIVAATRPSRIVIAMADRRGRIPDQSLLESRFRGVVVEDAVDFFERVTGKLAIESLKPSSLILSGGFRHSDFIRGSMRRTLRRCVSCVVASVTLVLTSPLLLLIALAIRLDSRGPVFFVQQRVGRGGKPFGLVKFRTMREHTGVQTSEWVTDNTSRITRVGKWLRRFRLDELPQFFNVVQGDMGLVGPRPHPVSNYELFLERIPYYAFRSMVRPGITGWAQVRYGYANDLEEETEKMRYDFYYIKHRSIELDVRILIETGRVLLFDRRSHQAAKSRVPTPASAWSGIGSAS
jgi:exopolysaccharide biosynthesis polyprenyl glycosylphosphotransferase